MVPRESCATLLEAWIRNLDAPDRDAGLFETVAGHVAQCAACRERLRFLGRVVEIDAEDPLTCEACQALLAELVHAETSGAEDDRFKGVRGHLVVCPACYADYRQVRDWVLASLADAVPVAEAYPAFDFSALASRPRPAPWPEDRLASAVARGRRWIDDAGGAVYALFGAAPPSGPLPAWSTKSSGEQPLLRHIVLDDALPGWEIEITAYAEDAAHCRVEVACYRLGAAEADLAGLPVTLRVDAAEEIRETDEGGVAEFTALPRSKLDQAVIRVGPVNEAEAG